MAFKTVCSAQTICYFYDPAGNRTLKIGGPCDEPSGLLVLPSNGRASVEGLSIAGPEVIDDAKISGKIVPNPTSSSFEVLLESMPPFGASFILYDNQGRALEKQLVVDLSTVFDIASGGTGVYYLVLKSNGVVIRKWTVVKQ